MFDVGDTIPAKMFVPIQGIYLIRNRASDKVYVGQSVNIQARWATHVVELSRQRHGNTLLQDEWDTYGEKAFVLQIVEIVPKKSWLYAVERRWIIACHREGLELYNCDTSAEQYIYHAPHYDECAKIQKEGYKKPPIHFGQIRPSRGATEGVAIPMPVNRS